MPKMRTVTVGQVQAAHGVHGELKIKPLCDDPKRFDDLDEIMLAHKEMVEKYTIRSRLKAMIVLSHLISGALCRRIAFTLTI